MSPARLDLAVEWRRRRWRRLLNIIDHLPRHSLFIEAVTQDEAIAEQLLDNPPKDQPASKPTRRMSEWSPVVELLTVAVNRLAELTQAVAAIGGAKPRKITPAPFPETVLEKLRKRRRDRNHRALVALVLPTEESDT